MKIEDESNMIEYKEVLPDDSNKWLKTIISFSNTNGGKLIVGITDSKEVIGIDKSRTSIENKVVNCISNNIEPRPIIDFSFMTIDNKEVFIVEVDQGSQPPYYLKKEGIDKSTYVRFGTSDLIATQAQILDMQLNSENLNFTDQIYKRKINKGLSESDINNFIKKINSINRDKKITLEKTLEWSLVLKEFSTLLATNGYMLLTSKSFPNAYIKIGIFEGKNKAKLLNEDIFEGSIIEQYQEVTKYLQNYFSKGYEFKLQREKMAVIPEEAIREIIANAIVHRNYQEDHPIRIEIYSDRLFVFSPGSLFDGLQLTDIENGVSKLRNRNIGEIFHNIGYIEKWGSGIQRANEVLESNNMHKLILDVENIHGVGVTILFEKKSVVESKEEIDVLQNIDTKGEQLLKHYEAGSDFVRRDVEEVLGITEHQARRLLEKLVKDKIIEKRGAGRNTHYRVV